MQKEQIMDQWEKKKIAAICVIVCLGLGVSLWRSAPAELEPATLPAQTILQEEAKAQKTVAVYVSGAVQKPGVYQVPANIRVQEALPYAGGMLEAANGAKVNLAKKCKDGMHINVPFKTGNKDKTTVKCKTATTKLTLVEKKGKKQEAAKIKLPEGKININTASREELIALPGVGEVIAAKIITYRQKKSFATIQELKQVPGIGESKFKALQHRLEV